jgi:hypothetical protein
MYTSREKGAGLYPMKWCSHRWLENKSVCQRAIDILPALKCYVTLVEKGKAENPGTKSFNTVAAACKDLLLEAKLSCFVSVSKLIEPFLTLYQTDKIMIPFLCDDLEGLLKRTMRRYLKVESNISVTQLLAMDLKSPENQLETSKIDVGYVGEQKVKELLYQKKISALAAMEYRVQAKAFLNGIVVKMMEKCPLKYRLVRNLACLSPKLLTEQTKNATVKFKRVLQCLVECNRLVSGEVDQLLEEFHEWSTTASTIPEFSNFSKHSDSLDALFHEHFSKQQHPMLWDVIKQLLIISHGQASVERGFSLGKALSKDNQLPETIANIDRKSVV